MMKTFSIWFTAISTLLLMLSTAGCLGDRLEDMGNGSELVPDDSVSPSAKDGGDDGGQDGGQDTDGEDTEEKETETIDPKALILNPSYYAGWEEADDSWAPGTVTTIVDDTHVGYLEARCWECHGKGMPFEPKTSIHDPRMQYWSWSCAAGFPGSTCHGHGYNGCNGFNHANDASFKNCTQSNCHSQHNGDPWYENHGFDDAPDAFCNSCHDSNWSGWPEEIM